MDNLTRIASFSVNHDYIDEGIYISRIDGDITTYDMRTRKPNCGDYMDNVTMHTVEHLVAVALRNGSDAEKVIYFGPMGCRTGFYAVLRNVTEEHAKTLIRCTLEKAMQCDTVPGATVVECGNAAEHDLVGAKQALADYLKILA